MPPGIGYSNQPFADADMQLQRGQGQGGQGSAPQQAIRTLSLRVPQAQTAGAPGLAPLPLLNAKGGGGTDLDMLLKALLKAFSGGAMQGGPGGMQPHGMGGPQAPRIIPGIDTPGDRGQGGPMPMPPPNIPRDFPGTGVPQMQPPFNMDRIPGGGILGGVLRGRTPGDAFPGGPQQVPPSNIPPYAGGGPEWTGAGMRNIQPLF